jgi:four helix bundle protein
MAVSSYRDLLVWKNAMQLTEDVYRLASVLPKHEQFALIAQLHRSAVSLPSNIAEGHSRDSTKDFLRFLSIAQGSLAELETQLLLAERFKYVEDIEVQVVLDRCAELGKMLNGLQSKLLNKLAPGL